MMVAWPGILDRSGDADSWGSRLAVAAYFLLLFAMVGHVCQLCVVFYMHFDTWLILCCFLQ